MTETPHAQYEVVSDDEWRHWQGATLETPCPHCQARAWSVEYFGDPISRIGAKLVWCWQCKCQLPQKGMVRMKIRDGVPIRGPGEPSQVPTDIRRVVSQELMRDIERTEASQRELAEAVKMAGGSCPNCHVTAWEILYRFPDDRVRGARGVVCKRCHTVLSIA